MSLKTKLVEIRLAALTRVEYMEVAEVPADITQEQLNALVNQRYAGVDAGLFQPDPEYWVRANSCEAVPCSAEDSQEPAIRVEVSPGGRVIVHRIEPVHAQKPDAAQEKRYVSSAGWGHIFQGVREDTTRWIYDRTTEKLVFAQIQNAGIWSDLHPAAVADLLADIQDNDAISNMADFDLTSSDAMDAFASVDTSKAFELRLTNVQNKCRGSVLRLDSGRLVEESVWVDADFENDHTDFAEINDVQISGNLWRFFEGTLGLETLVAKLSEVDDVQEFLGEFGELYRSTFNDEQASQAWEDFVAEQQQQSPDVLVQS